MAKYSGAQFSVLLVDGYSLLSAKVQSITDKVTNVVQSNTHGLGDSWDASSATGLRKATLTQTGAFLEDAVAGFHEAFKAITGVVRTVAYAMGGNTIGQPFTGLQGAYQGSYAVVHKVAGLTLADAEYVVAGAIDRGVIVQDWVPKTASWNTKTDGAPVDAGVGSSTGGVGYLLVSALTGFTAVAVKIRHSADDTTYVDLVTFAPVTAPPPDAFAAQRVTVTGTIGRYLSVSGTVTGSGSVTPFAGFVRT